MHTYVFCTSALCAAGDGPSSAVASDGRFLYIHNSSGLHKVGSGLGGTISGEVYQSNASFHTKDQGWLAFAHNKLFYRCLDSVTNTLYTVDRDTLQQHAPYDVEGTYWSVKISTM